MEDYDSDDVFTTEQFRPRREPEILETPTDPVKPAQVPSFPIRASNKPMDRIPEHRDDLQNGSLFGSVSSLDSSDNLVRDTKTLTVNRKWKVDEQLNRRMLASSKPSKLIPVAKWIATFLLAAGLLACLTASKVTILKLAFRLNVTTTEAENVEDRVKATRIFLMVFLAVVLPYFLNFLRALFVSLCRSDMPWPNRKSILLGILSATLESFGVCAFALKVLTYYNGVVAVLLMNCVFIIPFFSNMMQSIRSRERKSRFHNMCITGGFLLQCVGAGFTIYVVFNQTFQNETYTWHVFASVISISLAWIPALQQGAVKPKPVDDFETEMTQGHPPQNYGANSDSSGFNTGTTTPTSNNDSTEATLDDNTINDVTHAPQLRNTTWKMAIISNFVKVVGVMIFSFIFFYIDHPFNGDITFTEDTYEEFENAWRFAWDSDTESMVINILTTLGGYALGFIACHIAIQTWAFALPISLTGPGFVVVLLVSDWCEYVLGGGNDTAICMDNDEILWAAIVSSVCLLLAHVLCATYPIFRFKTLVLQRESAVFWIPSFNGVFLEQWLIVNRRTEVGDVHTVKPSTGKQKTRVYICTTMYRETEDEMRQLLESINRINMARRDDDRFFESHVIFDGGVRNKNVSEFALQLLTLLQETLNIHTENCTKVKTPYGMKLSWKLPRSNDNINHMTFNIHLKDGLKVKNKKRWSQVMYMSYVIDFLMESENDENCYILTTDADVKFTPESVEALLDLMTRDSRVGAVCARTHPMGSGPLVWYQVFEYAIGHWFQKAAEHVLGSVLCAPGCFSVYRCVALKEILTVYATNVEHAFDFLTKDMGEDRWLCTLMVQSGWRIEYCAASENATNCPSEFEEFYKQRRRWIASTIANLMLLMKQWQIIRHFNQRIALLFIVYEGALLFSTLIGPSTVILIISGGLTYAWNIDSVASVVIQLFICVGFAVVCLYMSDKNQMLAAKLLTFFYAIVMTAVIVGTAEQIVDDLELDRGSSDNETDPTQPPSDISIDLPISVTTIYFAAIAAIFGAAALLHPKESYCLVNGVWYLLCLPSGYLVLMIYSICNITDRSWGTREEKTESAVKKEPWYSNIRTLMENIFFCCGPKSTPNPPPPPPTLETQTSNRWPSTEDIRQSLESLDESTPEPSTPHQKTFPGSGSVRRSDPDDDIEQDIYMPVPVEDWLDTGLKEKYAQMFKRNGFENTMFISGMNEKELKSIGITVKAHLQFMLTEIEALPSFEIEYSVPSSVDEWLQIIGLYCYRRNFRRNHIKKPEDLSVLKSFKRKEIEKELKIIKPGHVKRLLYAIRKLRDPTEAEKRAIDMKAKVDRSPRHHLKRSNVGEYDFWKQLIHDSLKPGNKAFGIEGELKDVVEIGQGPSKTNMIKRLLGSIASFFSLERLSDLRNSWLLILAVSNTLWLILITTLASKGDLVILGANPLGLSFLFIFGTMLVIQFLAMIVHRISTLVHFLARAPFKYGAPMKAFWSFKDEDFRFQHAETRDDWEAIQTIKQQENRLREKKRQQRVQMSRSSYGSTTETMSLLGHQATSEM